MLEMPSLSQRGEIILVLETSSPTKDAPDLAMPRVKVCNARTAFLRTLCSQS